MVILEVEYTFCVSSFKMFKLIRFKLKTNDFKAHFVKTQVIYDLEKFPLLSINMRSVG